MKNFIRKPVLYLALLLTFLIPSFNTAPANAAGFLGLDHWYQGVTHGSDNTLFDVKQDCNGADYCMELSQFIWTIVLNVSKDLTIIAAYLAVGFVLYGGYKYILSNGDVNKVASGKKTLTQAIIGLAIVMLANIIFTTIRYVLSKGVTGTTGGDINLPNADADLLFIETIRWVIGVSGLVCAIFVVYGGISYITSTGDSNKVTKAKNTILYALIGLAIVALSTVITAFVANKIKESANNITSSTVIETTNLAKEFNEKQIY